jgi:hypothetical protein
MSRTRSSSALSLSIMFLAALISSGCSGDSSPTAPQDQTQNTPSITMSDLVGTWKASSAVFTNQANTSQQYDVVAEGGEVRTVILNDPARSRTWVQLDTAVDVFDQWDSGLALNVTGTELTVTPVETTRPTRHYTLKLVGDTLTLTSSDGAFDFSLTGAPGVAVKEVDVLIKQ